MDKGFSDPATPMVVGGNWPFYVYEDNAMNLEIEFSNLFPETGEEKYDTLKKSKEPLVEVNVVTLDGVVVYSFLKSDKEIIEETLVTEQITLFPGEWSLQIGFMYHSKGGDTPSNLKFQRFTKSLRWKTLLG